MVNNNLKSVICSTVACSILVLVFSSVCAPSYAQQKGGKVAAVDTFKLANQYVAKKKFRKAEKLYGAYHKNHPKDINSIWLQAQTKLWLNNYRQSDTLYKTALKKAPKNDYLRLNYIHALLDMGKLGQAGSMLTDMEMAGKEYSDMSALRARLNYYQGDHRQAAAYMKKALNAESNNNETNELSDEIDLARSPKISLSTAYLADNQSVTAIISTLKAESYFNKYLNLYLVADEYHFMQTKASDAPWVRVGDKLFFSEIGMHMNIGAGVYKYPVKDEVGWTGNLSINQRISQSFDFDLSVDHVPYFDTKSSIDTNISATRFAGMLNWHKRFWAAQAAFLNSTYPDNNNVYGTYGWVLAPIAVFPEGHFQVGYSISYANSTENRYRPENSLGQILANYTPGAQIAGIYDPYFTPGNMFINSALLSLTLNPSKKVNIVLSGDVGYGTIHNPYIFLNKDKTGATFADKGYSNESFVPYSGTFAFNWNIDKSWNLNAKYTYRSTYFFISSYASIGISKTFWHGKKKHTNDDAASTFSRLMKEIEGKIQGLYSCKNSGDLKKSVGKIRNQLVTLRDAQLKKKNTSEIVAGSDEAILLQDRYDGLNDMISEIDAVDLDDEGEANNKKEWMVDKLYELTNITYNGNSR
jgi:Tfp pilus assembly protein PilF